MTHLTALSALFWWPGPVLSPKSACTLYTSSCKALGQRRLPAEALLVRWKGYLLGGYSGCTPDIWGGLSKVLEDEASPCSVSDPSSLSKWGWGWGSCLLLLTDPREVAKGLGVRSIAKHNFLTKGKPGQGTPIWKELAETPTSSVLPPISAHAETPTSSVLPPFPQVLTVPHQKSSPATPQTRQALHAPPAGTLPHPLEKSAHRTWAHGEFTL